jgi:FMN phosphatase YigB (HAD superfamily)
LNKDEVIFIDDKRSYVDGTKAVGIHALLYTTTDKLKQDFAKNGVHVS